MMLNSRSTPDISYKSRSLLWYPKRLQSTSSGARVRHILEYPSALKRESVWGRRAGDYTSSYSIARFARVGEMERPISKR